jgi:hypothetical protein
MRKILYTLDAYNPGTHIDFWFTRVSQKRNQWYADRFGAEYRHIKIESPNRRPPHYHKLQVFEDFLKSDSDRGVFFDMDIFVEENCPDIWGTFPEGLALCYDYFMPMGHYYQWCNQTYGKHPSIKYRGKTKHHDDKGPTWRYFNTGVIIFDKEFAKFILDNVKPWKHQPENGEWIQYPDGWGEQHNFNYLLDKYKYPVTDIGKDFNELVGRIFSETPGKYISHYAAPCGRLLLAQRERHADQGSFQRKYLKGKILNVGCNTDYARLKEDFGAYNIDLRGSDLLTGYGYPIDEVMDARFLNPEWTRTWDTVVLGEILEHMNKEDRIATLKEAIRVTRKNGWINITIPHDERDVFQQHSNPTHETDSLEYAKGISAFHAFNYTDEDCRRDIREVGLEILAYEPMEYGFRNTVTNEPVIGSCYLCCKPAHMQRIRDNWDLLYDVPQPEDNEKIVVPDPSTVDPSKTVPTQPWQADLMYGFHGVDWIYASENK